MVFPSGPNDNALWEFVVQVYEHVCLLLEPLGSNTVSRYLRSGPFPAFSSHLLWSPVNSHQLLETPVGVSFISLFVISWTHIM